MNNELYQLMIINVKKYISEFNPSRVYSEEEQPLSAFQISEVLSLCLAKSKESILENLLK